MISRNLHYKKYFYVIFLLFFSIIINQYYAGKGIFPIDSFLHFDSSYRILNGEYPFKDFWIVSGPIINYIQAIFFSIFGVNWQSYVFHASVLNAIVALSTFFILKEFKLKLEFCFLYSLLLSILAYPVSGTPFVDLHSAFFSLLAAYCLIIAFKKQKKFNWFLISILLGFAFFSKQVPASYFIISTTFILIFYSLINKNFGCIQYSLIGGLFFILFVFIFGAIQGIELSSFLNQYIFYPQTIGIDRFQNSIFTFNGVIGHFKFIYLALIPLIYFNFIKIYNDKNYLKSSDFFIFLVLIFLTFSLIFHQLLTKNQTFIFFLIPILTGFSHISFLNSKLKNKNIIYFVIISFCLFATIKYHLRFNEGRKFHELNNTNLAISINAQKISYKLTGLNWITPQFKNQPKKEIEYINEIKSILKNDKRNKMLITNYSFFSAILEEKLSAPSFAYANDGTTHPLKGNLYLNNYKKLMFNLIKKNNISVIYIAGLLNEKHLYDYIDRSCFNEKLIFDQFKSYAIKECKDIKK